MSKEMFRTTLSRIILPGGVVGLVMPVKAKSAEFPAELIMDEEVQNG